MTGLWTWHLPIISAAQHFRAAAVAEREGYFDREGLNFSMLPVPGGGEKLIAALHQPRRDSISHPSGAHGLRMLR
jgi:hypothetical protein